MGAVSGEHTHVRMTNLERAIGMSRDGPYLAGSSSMSNLSQFGEADGSSAYEAYDRMESQALKAIESLFSSTTDLLSVPRGSESPHSTPVTTSLPGRWARFVNMEAASAIVANSEAPGFDAVPEYSSGMFLNGIEAC